MDHSKQTKKLRIKRIELVGIIATIVLPALFAWMIYVNPDWKPYVSSNYGTIIVPARPVPEVSFNLLNAEKKLDITEFRGKWVLVSVADSSCADGCKDNLYKMHQMRRALGKDRGRVERLVVLINDQYKDQFKAVVNKFKGTTVAIGPKGSVSKILSILEPSGKAAIDHIYIIDPLGNIMMHYFPDADGVKILEDLEHLLKVSQIG